MPVGCAGGVVAFATTKLATTKMVTLVPSGITIPNTTTSAVVSFSWRPSSGSPGVRRRTQARSRRKSAPPSTTPAAPSIHHHRVAISRDGLLRGSSADCSPQPPSSSAAPPASTRAAAPPAPPARGPPPRAHPRRVGEPPCLIVAAPSRRGPLHLLDRPPNDESNGMRARPSPLPALLAAAVPPATTTRDPGAAAGSARRRPARPRQLPYPGFTETPAPRAGRR